MDKNRNEQLKLIEGLFEDFPVERVSPLVGLLGRLSEIPTLPDNPWVHPQLENFNETTDA